MTDLFKRIIQLAVPPGQSAWLWGARKTGKSTFLRQNFSHSTIFDLLDSDRFLSYSKRPALFREEILALSEEERKYPIIIDEVQKIPPLLDEVHLLIETYKLSFILCGSSARKLKHGHANLLGGRAWRYEMFPLSYIEIPDFSLIRALQVGLIPSHYLSPDPKRALKSYVSDYLQLEIQQEGLIRNLPAFSRFLDAAAFSANELLNYSSIAREVGVDAKTVKEYFQILVDTLLGYFLPPLSLRKKRREILSTPKFYFFDVGLANILCKRNIEEPKGAEAGKAFENFILMELVACKSYQNKDFTLSFWRTKTGIEVDFILQESSTLIAIEVKISSSIDKKDCAGLVALQQETTVSRSIIICLEKRKRIVTFESCPIEIMPFSEFLTELWSGKIL